MDDNTVSFVAFEAQGTRMFRIIKWLSTIILVQTIIMVAMGIGIFLYSQQYTQETTTMIEAEQEGAEVNILGLGDVNYGNAEDKGNTDH